jgi:hypothetical protein
MRVALLAIGAVTVESSVVLMFVDPFLCSVMQFLM